MISDGVRPILQVWKRIFVGRDQVGPRLDQQVDQEDCIVDLIFVDRSKRFDWTWYSCLPVRQIGEGLYEQVGVLDMHGLDLDPYFTWTKDSPCAVPDQMVFLDAMGNVLDNFTISDRQKSICSVILLGPERSASYRCINGNNTQV